VLCGIEYHIVGKSLVFDFKNGGFVHVIPNACYADFFDEFLVQICPPIAYFGLREVRKITLAGPHFTFYKWPVGMSAEIAFFQAFIKNRVVFILLNTGVYDDHQYPDK